MSESEEEEALPDNHQTCAKGDVLLCLLYWDIEQGILEKVKNVIKFSSDENIPLILASDFNVHSESWGSTVSNPRGNIMEDIIVENNLAILNKGCKPTFGNRRC